ncbi:MAG: hypothetical protein KDE27_21035 [Planctomycetes bacterium]|nr:hypothetical protein [Planctomycetota bacterium]
MTQRPRTARVPRWFLLLPVLAVLLWWPLDPYWQSDDFLALHYAHDFGNVLHDFVGPQYGATDIWLFYRPLITLSFWFDGLVAGAEPFWSHLSNVLSHGVSTLLVALLWRRFLPDSRAFLAALLWAAIPGHVGTLAWAVGRVDCHTVVWCLLALLLFVRQCERVRRGEPARRWPTLAAFALALMSKELAFVVPALMVLLAWLTAAPGTGQRWRFALRQTAPAWLLFAGYLALRWLALGRFGGYLGSSYDPAAMFAGLATYVANLAVPLRWSGKALAAATGLPGWLALAAASAPLLPAILYWGRRPLRLLAAVLVFGVASAPLAAFLAGADNVHNLRYFYLPSIVLAGLLAAPGPLAAGCMMLAWALPFVAVRAEQRAADRESAAAHAAMLQAAADGAASPMFVAGLPHSNPSGTAVQLHFGVDRMLLPPFGDGRVRPLALRPLVDAPAVFRLSDDNAPTALPAGSTFRFDGSATLVPAPAPTPLPDLPITGDAGGVVDFTTSLDEATANFRTLFEQRRPSFGIATPGVKPALYRLTIFTANGYLCCSCADYGLGPAGAGWLDGLRLLVHDPVSGTQAARTALRDDALASADLVVPTAIDLSTDFPVLLEAGSATMGPRGVVFRPTHRARRLLIFRFGRSYAAWVRLVQGKG